MLQTVDRTVEILRLFTPETPLLGISDISRLLDLDRSVVQRTIASLVNGDLLEQHEISSKYCLGFGLLELSGTMLQGRNLLASIRPFLRELVNLVGESAYVGVLYQGNSVLQLDSIDSTHLIQYSGWTGIKLPLYSTASGKIILANMETGQCEQLLSTIELQAFTNKTITDRQKLCDELVQAKEQGYALSLEEFEDGINSIAAILPNKEGATPAALTIIGPKYRLPKEKAISFADTLKAAANQIPSRFPFPVSL